MAHLLSPTFRVVEYDPRWPFMFAAEKARILGALNPFQVTVEHVGSTAVPGLDAKPIIDVLVGVCMVALTEGHLNALRLLGYGYVRARRGRLCLYRGRPRSHFIHIVEMAGTEWQEQILFRDYLRAHSEDALRYAVLKREMAAGGATGATYARGKRGLIVEIIGRARRWDRGGRSRFEREI